jgi:hypothetical protein
MNLEELLKTANLEQEQLHPAETTTLITLLEYDVEAAKAIVAKIKSKVAAREKREALRKEVEKSFKKWLESENNNGEQIIALSFRAPDQVIIRFSSEPELSSPRPRRSRSRSSDSEELLAKIEQLGYKVSTVKEQTRGGNLIEKFAVRLEDGSVLKDQWLKRLYERLTKIKEE